MDPVYVKKFCKKALLTIILRLETRPSKAEGLFEASQDHIARPHPKK
jgi:hypothetical protein